MAKDYKVQVIIPHNNGIPRDSIVNSFSFRGPDIPGEADRSALVARFNSFYNLVNPPGSARLLAYMSNQMNPAAAVLKVFRRDDPMPRQPVIDYPMNLGGPGGSAGPHELACVLSFQASRLSGVPQSRRRGRIFFGPLATTAYTTAEGDTRPNPLFRDVLAQAGKSLQLASDAVWTWGVWSAYSGHATVVSGWVDNAMDIQRRRGLKATVRTLW